MLPRRKDIITRAADVVYRKGFGASRVADILKVLKVGRGNFYHYFRGKEDLGVAIIDELGREIGGVDLDDVFSPLKPPMQRLSDYLELIRATCTSGHSADPLCTLACELGTTAPFADHIRQALSSLIERVEALIAEFAAESHATVNAHRLARVVVAQVHGICTQFKVDKNIEDFAESLASVPETVLSAVAPATGPARAAQPQRLRMHG